MADVGCKYCPTQDFSCLVLTQAVADSSGFIAVSGVFKLSY